MNYELTPSQRRYVSYIRRCDEMERRLEYFAKQLAKFSVKIEDNAEIEEYLATTKANKAVTSEQLLASLEVLLEEKEAILKELEKYNIQLTTQYNEKVEQKFVLEHGNLFFRKEDILSAASEIPEETDRADKLGRFEGIDLELIWNKIEIL